LRLYSYVVKRDFGFAPNPFFNVCTLATCKPEIRAGARVGDWIVGTGSYARGAGGLLVYAMQISQVLSYDEYWSDPRFLVKRPNLRGSLKQAFRDNIYHHNPTTGRWVQEDSHHSHADGRPNRANLKHDTRASRVLVGFDFVYFGNSGPQIPECFRKGSLDLCARRGHHCNFSEKMVLDFVSWLRSLGARGLIADPQDFRRV
jgi:putative DNA base modification enzyme with NMAD domain